MIMDSTLLFDSAVAITATRQHQRHRPHRTSATSASATRSSCSSSPDGLFAASGAGTLTVTVQTSVDNSTYTDQLSSRAFSIAQLNTLGLPARHRLADLGRQVDLAAALPAPELHRGHRPLHRRRRHRRSGDRPRRHGVLPGWVHHDLRLTLGRRAPAG